MADPISNQTYFRPASLQGPEQSYDPDALAEEIKKIRAAGKKVFLYICRTENQPLPSEEGCVWVSGDIAVHGIIPPSRLHIWADFTNEEHLKRFYGLFDKLVVDLSSVKFLGVDFISRLVPLLNPSQDAEFVFENMFFTSLKSTGSPVVTKDSIEIPKDFYKKTQEVKEEWVKQAYPKDSPQYAEEFSNYYPKIKQIATQRNWSEKELHRQCQSWIIQTKFPADINPETVLVDQATALRKNHLEEYFRLITLFENQIYPYLTNGSKATFFVAKNLK